MTEHGIDVGRVLADTRPVWDAVGSDFVARLQQNEPPASNVVLFAQRHAARSPVPSRGGDGPEAAAAEHRSSEALTGLDRAIAAADQILAGLWVR